MMFGKPARLVARFARFSAQERGLLVEATLRTMWTSMALLASSRGLISHALTLRPAGRSDENARAIAATIARLVPLATRHAPGVDTCLTRALVVHQMLTRRHIESRFRIGVTTQAGRFDAHAWVEFAGQPLNEAASVNRFSPFPGMGEADARQ